MTTKVPSTCKKCQHFWAHGIKDGKHDRWCCYHGKPAPIAFSHCKVVGGYKAKEV